MKDRAPHSELFTSSKTPSMTTRPTSFLNIFLCDFVTEYGREKIGFSLFFNSESNGYVSQVRSVPMNSSSNL